MISISLKPLPLEMLYTCLSKIRKDVQPKNIWIVNEKNIYNVTFIVL
jgi:hypothetical protein